jgi:hypothetical protein
MMKEIDLVKFIQVLLLIRKSNARANPGGGEMVAVSDIKLPVQH